VAKQIMLAGTTSRREYIFILDSSSTVGAGRTGLTSATAGWKVYYVRPGAVPLPITLTAAVGPTIAFTSASLSEVDATNMPGVYRFDVPDVVFAAGQDKAIVMLSGPTNVAPVTLEYQLTAAGEPWIAGGIWNAQLANYASAGSGETFGTDTYGTKVSRTTTPNRNLSVSGTQAVTLNAASVTAATFQDDALIIGAAAGSGIKIRFAADAITSTVIAADAIQAAELSASAVQEIADGVLSRNLDSSGNEVSTTSSGRTVRNALRILRNKVDASGGTQVDVYNEADTTIIWSQPITTSVTADPIVKVGA